MTDTVKIVLIPLDNRPVSYTLPQQIASLNKNIKVFAPPREFLGGLVSYSQVDKILEWLDEILKQEKIDYIVASLDTIAYGGLIPSRRLNTSPEEIIKNLTIFKKIVNCNRLPRRGNAPPRNDGLPKIYAFSSIMRISDSYVNEEEKEYWDKFGKEIFKYSYFKHKADVIARNEAIQTPLNNEWITSSQAPRNDEQTLQELKNKIPPEILDDYLKTRERNFSINRFYLKWIEEKFLDFLVYSKDDTGQFGINVQEAETLDSEIQDKKLFGKAITLTGADEIPSDLMSKAIVDNADCEQRLKGGGDEPSTGTPFMASNQVTSQKIKIFPVFSTENGKNVISRYEDKTILESVSGQIKLCGGEIADSEENADMVMLVHTPKNIQNDHCLKIYPEPENKEAVKFCIDFIKNSQKPVIVGDISCANGGDNLLVMQILDKTLDINKIYGYAGWNTTGNTLGSVISIGISRFIAEKTGDFELNNFKKTLLVRLVDDWAYQTIVRQKIRAITNLADRKTLKEELVPLVLNLTKKIEYNLNLSDFNLDFPWNRTFEVEIII